MSGIQCHRNNDNFSFHCFRTEITNIRRASDFCQKVNNNRHLFLDKKQILCNNNMTIWHCWMHSFRQYVCVAASCMIYQNCYERKHNTWLIQMFKAEWKTSTESKQNKRCIEDVVTNRLDFRRLQVSSLKKQPVIATLWSCLIDSQNQ